MEVRRALAHILRPGTWHRRVLLDLIGYVNISHSQTDHQEPALNIAGGRVCLRSGVVDPLENLGPCFLVLMDDFRKCDGLVFPVCPVPDGERLE